MLGFVLVRVAQGFGYFTRLRGGTSVSILHGYLGKWSLDSCGPQASSVPVWSGFYLRGVQLLGAACLRHCQSQALQRSGITILV